MCLLTNEVTLFKPKYWELKQVYLKKYYEQIITKETQLRRADRHVMFGSSKMGHMVSHILKNLY